VESVKVNIREIAAGGAGVGEVFEGSEKLLGITAFVPFTVRGEKVTARVVEKKERFIRTALEALESPSEERVEPRCAVYGQCGGCELQHMSYEEQLSAKQSMILGALRSRRFSEDELSRVSIIEASTPYNYRRRINLHVSEEGKIGFYRAKSRAVVPISQCEISDLAINEALESCQSLGKVLSGKVSSIVLESDQEGVIALLGARVEPSKSEIDSILNAAKECFSDATLISSGKELGGFGRKILEIPVSAGGAQKIGVPLGEFSQVNSEVNQKMVDYVLEASQVKKGSQVHDLYSGAGNFTIPLAKKGAEVVAVECSAQLTSFCSRNAEKHGVSDRVKVVDKSVEKFLKGRKGEGKVDLVVVDPPRSGLNLIARELSYSERVILISCQLVSFARDLKILVESGWALEEVKPFDMFAQTSHLELVGVLSREK